MTRLRSPLALSRRGLLLGLALGALAAPVRAQQPAAVPRTAALPPAGALPAGDDLPRPLSAADAALCRDLFALQEKGRWREADALIARLGDRLLLGHLLAQRYLHPTLYRSSFRELADWLAFYADHPDAPRIHRLALKRRPSGAPKPAEPQVAAVARVGTPDEAEEAAGPDWEAGLAAFRKERPAAAAAHFERVAEGHRSAWSIAAGAFWAARSHRAADRPAEAEDWLRVAADFPRTFYGQLALASLGLRHPFDWTLRPLGAGERALLLGEPAGRRGLALLQVGERARAAAELHQLATGAPPPLATALLILSLSAQMPTLALRLGTAVERQPGAVADAALYPIPAWQPRGGFAVDPALLYALMRHESGFNPEARGPGGAAGLMQLMPATAAAMARGERGLPAGERAWFDPEVNLTLGQKYVQRLLADPAVNGNLILLPVAYNVGPGGLAKLRAKIRTGDPLLFVESLPSRVTRLLVERVLASMWIYQQRLGRPTRSLAALAEGRWPIYARPAGLGAVADVQD